MKDLKQLLDKDFAESMSTKEKQETYKMLYEAFDTFSNIAGFGDPFSFARSREFLMACELNHTVASDYSGADGVNEKGEKVEYKSTIAKEIKAAYTGISVFPTWEEQEKYLCKEKIGYYAEHYWARFETGKIVEMYKVFGEQALEMLLPKLKKMYHSSNKKRKDPRLYAHLSAKEIKAIAERIL